MNTITFYLEDNDHKEVNFIDETITFTLQMIKIWTNMITYNYMYIYMSTFIQVIIFICVLNELSKI